MNIPAMDAVRSKRFGYISSDKATVATILHDELVGNRNFGGDWRISRPVFLRTSEPADIVRLIENAEEHRKNNFSDSFWEEIAKLYRAISEHYEGGEDVEIIPQNGANEFEAMFISNTLNVVLNEGPSHDLWHTVIEESQWSRVDDAETGDVNVLGEDGDRSFEQSKFEDQKYIPQSDDMDSWGLYSYSWRHEGKEVDSLWIRFRSGDEIKEYPLIESSNGLCSIVSVEPDFGSIESDHISDEVQTALSNSEVLETGTSVEQSLTEMVKSVETCDKTQYFIDNARNSTEVGQ